MESIANLTQTDINNGVLTRMLANAGINDIQTYVNQFNHEVEELIVEELEYPNRNRDFNDQQSKPQIGIQDLMAGLGSASNESVQVSTVSKPQKKQPANLNSFIQGIVPIDNATLATDTTSNENEATTYDLGSALFDWSKGIGQEPPPQSLDDWLTSLVPANLHEPSGQANDPKGRLQAYLNATEKVLSRHGYNVSTPPTPSTNNAAAKVGILGNVKQMYFIWKRLDKNNDRKITVEDVQIMLAEMGLGFLSKYVAQALFDMVDADHDGQLQFRDFVALMSIIKELISVLSSVKSS